MIENGEGELVYEGKWYDLKAGDNVVFIACLKACSMVLDFVIFRSGGLDTRMTGHFSKILQLVFVYCIAIHLIKGYN